MLENPTPADTLREDIRTMPEPTNIRERFILDCMKAALEKMESLLTKSEE